MDLIDLSVFFATKSQASDFAEHIAAVSEQIYRSDFNLEQALQEQLGIRKKDAFLTMLRETKIMTTSNQALTEFLKTIQDRIHALPVLSISLAFEPTEQTLKVISEWFLLNMHKQVLFDITVQPQLLAGAAINYNGRFADFSIKTTFEKITALEHPSIQPQLSVQAKPIPNTAVVSQQQTIVQPTAQPQPVQQPTTTQSDQQTKHLTVGR
jgi:hypothetical protein